MRSVKAARQVHGHTRQGKGEFLGFDPLALEKPGIGIGCFDVFAAMAGKDTDCPLLVAVEMLPDIMRTIANVTMNVAVATATDREIER